MITFPGTNPMTGQYYEDEVDEDPDDRRRGMK